MENTSPQSNRLHPLMAAAAGAVIVASLVGVAAMTGILPKARGNDGAPVAPQIPVAAVAPLATASAASIQPAAPAATRSHVRRISHPVSTEPPYRPEPQQRVAVNQNVGTVESITPITQQGQGTGLGAVGGAVAGGLLGHQIGGGNGRIVATVLGALGGGVAGNMVEQRVRSDTEYQVRVRMEDGSSRVVTYHQQPNVGVGQRVRVENGAIVDTV